MRKKVILLSLLILLSFSAIGLNYFRKALREKYSYLSQKLVKSSMEQERKLIGSNLIAADPEGANLRSPQLDRVDLSDALLVNAD